MYLSHHGTLQGSNFSQQRFWTKKGLTNETETEKILNSDPIVLSGIFVSNQLQVYICMLDNHRYSLRSFDTVPAYQVRPKLIP